MSLHRLAVPARRMPGAEESPWFAPALTCKRLSGQVFLARPAARRLFPEADT